MNKEHPILTNGTNHLISTKEENEKLYNNYLDGHAFCQSDLMDTSIEIFTYAQLKTEEVDIKDEVLEDELRVDGFAEFYKQNCRNQNEEVSSYEESKTPHESKLNFEELISKKISGTSNLRIIKKENAYDNVEQPVFEENVLPCNLKEQELEKKSREPNKNPTWYRCPQCEFKTIHRCSSGRHLLIHTKASEAKLFGCEKCDFKTKQKDSLKKHSLIHKDRNELPLIRCPFCDYTTYRKSYLRRHSLIHKNPNDVTWFQCKECLFKSKRKYYLKDHMIVHGDPSEMYRCLHENCSYRTKWKKYLQRHSLTHRSPDEGIWFECTQCSYKTREKGNLNRHILRYHDKGGTIFNCDKCSYGTKFSNIFKSHILRHKSLDEVDVFKCLDCSFQTKYKNNIRNHVKKHQTIVTPKDYVYYWCYHCNYKTKHKQVIRRHLSHDFKCTRCKFRTKCSSDFKNHSWKHSDPDLISETF